MVRKRKTQRARLELLGKTVEFDIREVLAMLLGFFIVIALVASGDLETGKTVALALVFFGIGRSTK